MIHQISATNIDITIGANHTCNYGSTLELKTIVGLSALKGVLTVHGYTCKRGVLPNQSFREYDIMPRVGNQIYISFMNIDNLPHITSTIRRVLS